MKQYIITADDYGMCPEVSEAIEHMALGGFISTTNVMMNFGTDFSKSPLIGLPNFSLGIHWNVTTGKPLSSPSAIPTLVDENGNFHPIGEFRRRFRTGRIRKKELEIELCRQYEEFEKSFGKPHYWNSHENSALYPGEYSVFRKVALEHGIRGTRNFQRVYVDYDLAPRGMRRLREGLVRTYINFKFGKIERKKFAMPDARIVTFENISKTDVQRMRTALEATDKKIVEIIIHPATRGDNPLFGNIGEDRVLAEFAAHPDADVIIFHFETDDPKHQQLKYKRTHRHRRHERMPWGGIRIAFRLSSIQKANLWFTTLFGGGGVFPSGEDSMWLLAAKRAGLRFYVSGETIGTVSFAESTWFSGYDKRFFFGKGAFYAAVHPKTFGIWTHYFSWRTRSSSPLSKKEKMRWMKMGRRGYREMKGYGEYENSTKKE